MSDDSEYRVTDFSIVRIQLDDILVEQISRLIEIDLAAAALSFNLATITSLFLLVDRERDIQNHTDNPPERYDMQSFLKELESIGLEIDDDLIAALQSLAQCGYMEKDKDEKYSANISAFTLVAFLDNLFPGMKGLNLVGYIIQAITEVVSGRKKLEDAKMYLQQTLFSQGVSLSRQTFAHSQKENLKNQVKQQGMNQALADDMRKAYLERLETLRSLKDEVSTKPSFISRYGTGSGDNIKIREVFPRHRQEIPEEPVRHDHEKKPEVYIPPTPPQPYIEIKAETEEPLPAPVNENQPDTGTEEKTEIPQVIAAVKSTETEPQSFIHEQKQDGQILPDDQKPEPVPEKKILPEAEPERQAEPEIRPVPEPESKSESRQSPKPEAKPEEDNNESVQDDEDNDSEIDDDDEIERQIAAFSEELALPCPVCETGRVKSAETEKGRTYFKCSNHTCNFVSWSKPYNFRCPVCSNPFLVEYTNPDGTLGLKCPRATCSYTQAGIANPAAPAVLPSGEAPKKKKLVRRVKKKI